MEQTFTRSYQIDYILEGSPMPKTEIVKSGDAQEARYDLQRLIRLRGGKLSKILNTKKIS